MEEKIHCLPSLLIEVLCSYQLKWLLWSFASVLVKQDSTPSAMFTCIVAGQVSILIALT